MNTERDMAINTGYEEDVTELQLARRYIFTCIKHQSPIQD